MNMKKSKEGREKTQQPQCQILHRIRNLFSAFKNRKINVESIPTQPCHSVILGCCWPSTKERPYAHLSILGSEGCFLPDNFWPRLGTAPKETDSLFVSLSPILILLKNSHPFIKFQWFQWFQSFARYLREIWEHMISGPSCGELAASLSKNSISNPRHTGDTEALSGHSDPWTHLHCPSLSQQPILSPLKSTKTAEVFFHFPKLIIPIANLLALLIKAGGDKAWGGVGIRALVPLSPRLKFSETLESFFILSPLTIPAPGKWHWSRDEKWVMGSTAAATPVAWVPPPAEAGLGFRQGNHGAEFV